MTIRTTVICFLLLFVTRTVAAQRDAERFYFPTPDVWKTASTQEANCDPRKLENALQFAGAHHSKGVVVLWRGEMLAERYWDGWTRNKPHPAYSASKGVVSTLVGIAIDDGNIRGVDQSAADFLTEWQHSPAFRRITFHDLLSMSAGLKGGKFVFLRGLLARDERAFATGLPIQHRPGSHWEYHNSAYRLCFPLLESASGQSLQRYTKAKLLQPLGMSRTRWATKRFSPDQYTFLETTPRDAARFGLLVLAGGNWNGEQIVSSNWIKRSTHPTNPALNPSYGYLWWLNGGSHHYLPLNPSKQTGPIFPGCPKDTVAALGKDDQKIYVVPSLDLVVTRFGDAADSSTPAISKFDAEFLGKICGSLTQTSQSD